VVNLPICAIREFSGQLPPPFRGSSSFLICVHLSHLRLPLFLFPIHLTIINLTLTKPHDPPKSRLFPDKTTSRKTCVSYSGGRGNRLPRPGGTANLAVQGGNLPPDSPTFVSRRETQTNPKLYSLLPLYSLNRQNYPVQRPLPVRFSKTGRTLSSAAVRGRLV
jgi:hypothetical protein